MANCVLHVPAYFRNFTVSASSNSNGVYLQFLRCPLNYYQNMFYCFEVLQKIRRPMLRTRTNDVNKVQQLLDSISEIGLQAPVKKLYCFLSLFMEEGSTYSKSKFKKLTPHLIHLL
ncbi:putative sulfiredoxin [Lupinus albus]|uniref:Putative sulfiredoxin n=1 Tax=Lupinus albus TaxID=3870 RepID=A0A6A4Q120_LUPAL|nr:putative sulfiredoxin [Lupinus albus]